MELFDKNSAVDAEHRTIFKVTIPQLVKCGHSNECIIRIIADSVYGIDLETFIRDFPKHPEWPSVTQIEDTCDALRKNLK